MAALTTAAAVKDYIPSVGQDPDPSHDPLIERLIAGVSAQFEAETGRSFTKAARAEIRSGTGRNFAVLAHYPVDPALTITVKVNGATIPKQTAVGESGWVLLDGPSRIALVGYVFTEGVANVELGYTAGYATIPGDVEQAVIKMVALQFKDRRRVGVQSQSAAGEGIAYSDAGALAYWRTIVNLYRALGC